MRGPLQVTYSCRVRDLPVALARGIQIDVFTLTSLLAGVFALGETGRKEIGDGAPRQLLASARAHAWEERCPAAAAT